MCMASLRYLSKAMVSSREPTSRSGYLLPSTSRPPDREYPKVLNPGETTWPLITCRETDRLTGVTYSWPSSHRCVQCQTWLGSVETPSLLPLQIITLPVSWNGAPTAKSDTQRSESSSHIRLLIIHQSLQSVFYHVLTLEAILVEVSRSGHRHTEGWSGWSSQHYTGLRIKPTSCVHVNINCPAHLLLTMEIKRCTHHQVVPPAGENQPINVTVFYSDFRLLLCVFVTHRCWGQRLPRRYRNTSLSVHRVESAESSVYQSVWPSTAQSHEHHLYCPSALLFINTSINTTINMSVS